SALCHQCRPHRPYGRDRRAGRRVDADPSEDGIVRPRQGAARAVRAGALRAGGDARPAHACARHARTCRSPRARRHRRADDAVAAARPAAGRKPRQPAHRRGQRGGLRRLARPRRGRDRRAQGGGSDMSELGLPRAERPEAIGLSSERLARITATIRADVERRLIPGAVLAIARGGRLGYAEAIGFRDREAAAPMTLDAIFRVASMTKPAMSLAEEGRLDLSAPVAEYIPEFADMTVGVERRKAARAMTVQDLLRHTSGLTYAQFGDSPVQMIWRDAKLMDDAQTNAELVGKLARLPLMFEPGTTWEYSMSTDVLGRVVEVASGLRLGAAIAARVTGPLGMTDTGFSAPGERAARLAQPQTDAATGQRPPMRDPAKAPVWESGGGGLVST